MISGTLALSTAINLKHNVVFFGSAGGRFKTEVKVRAECK